ncbi:MAG: efflux RND transporter periplasmic adaptor subunit [Planctomycetota bacterium]
MKRRILVVLILAGVAGGVAFGVLRKAAPGDMLAISGNVEATDAQLAFRVPGLLIERLVDEGDRVTAGQVLARLDTTDIDHEIEAREAEVAAASAQVQLLEAGNRAEDIAIARYQVARARTRLGELEAGSLPDEVSRAQAAVDAARQTLNELQAGPRPEEIAAARAMARRAEAQLADLKAGSRPEELAQAVASVEAAKSRLDQAKRDMVRNERLAATNAVPWRDQEMSQTNVTTGESALAEAEARLALLKAGARAQQIEMARAAADEANQHLQLLLDGNRKEAIARATAQLRSAEASLALVKAGPRAEIIAQAKIDLQVAESQLARTEAGARSEEIAAAHARLRQANALLSRSQSVRDFALLRAPSDGIVMARHAEPGEFLATGAPVVTIANLSEVLVRAFIGEREMGRVGLGATVIITADAYSGREFTGTISFIASEAEFTPKTVQTTDERVNLVYRIRVRVPNPDGALKPGMPVDLTIKPGATQSQPN